MIKSLAIALALLVMAHVRAANVYIRDGASGSGADWNNALDDLPGSLTRGDVYYIADGTYSGYIFDDAESSASVITIKKATASDHGTETGWSSTYGDGQAFFNGDLIFARDYYVINGVTRDENDWNNPDAYGIRAKSVYGQNVNFPPGGDNITIQYCDLGGAYSETHTSGLDVAVYNGGFGGSFHHWTISRCSLHNSIHAIVQFAGVHDHIVEYCWIGPGWGKEAIRGQIEFNNVIIRHNTFYDSTQIDPEDPTSGITAECGIWSFDSVQTGIEIYGNTFTNSKSGGRNAVIVVGGDGSGWSGSAANGTKIYNNTFAGVEEDAIFGAILLNGTGTEAKNNLFYDCADTGISAAISATNVNATIDPFVNYGSLDLRITSSNQARNAGTNLGGSPYNLDRLSVNRGGDGTWDVGAFEFDSGGSGPIGAPGARKIGRGSKIRMVR